LRSGLAADAASQLAEANSPPAKRRISHPDHVDLTTPTALRAGGWQIAQGFKLSDAPSKVAPSMSAETAWGFAQTISSG